MSFAGRSLFAAALFVVCLFAKPMSARAEQVTFEQDFRQTFSPMQLRLTGGEQPTKYCKASPDGLRCTIPSGDDHVSACGVEARFVVRGDFVIVAGYQLLEAPKPDQGQGAGVKISIKDLHGEWASLQRIHLSKNGQVFSAHRAVKQPGDKYQHSSQTQPAQSDRGRLRLVREKDELIYSVAEGDATEFTELRREPFTNGELAQLYLATQTGGAKTGIDAVWTTLSVRADAIHRPGMAVAPRQPPRWPYYVMAAAGALVLLAAIVMFVRRQIAK